MLLPCKQTCLSQLGYVKLTKHGLLLLNTCTYTANVLRTQWHNVLLCGVLAPDATEGLQVNLTVTTASAGLCKR